MKTSGHFDDEVSRRPDRIPIRREWCERALREPEYTEPQSNGWMRHWIYVSEVSKWLKIVVQEDGETVHTNFFDRDFRAKLDRF
jgi:hypothetical protein